MNENNLLDSMAVTMYSNHYITVTVLFFTNLLTYIQKGNILIYIHQYIYIDEWC